LHQLPRVPEILYPLPGALETSYQLRGALEICHPRQTVLEILTQEGVREILLRAQESVWVHHETVPWEMTCPLRGRVWEGAQRHPRADQDGGRVAEGGGAPSPG
jgi:hypothetical protein